MADVSPIQYDRPPIREVAAGIQFDPIVGLQPVQVGGFWQAVRDQFPKVLYGPAAPTGVDPLQAPFVPQETGRVIIGPGFLPIELRYRFQSADAATMIQLQSNFLAFNWSQTPGGSPYPGYADLVRPGFLQAWRSLNRFVSESDIGMPRPKSCSVTYFSVIPADERGTKFDQFGDVLAFWKDGALGDMVPAPAWVGCHVVFPIDGLPGAAVEVDYQPIQDGWTGSRAIRMITTGIVPITAASEDEVMGKLDTARRHSVDLFDKLTGDRMHKAWGRKE